LDGGRAKDKDRRARRGQRCDVGNVHDSEKNEIYYVNTQDVWFNVSERDWDEYRGSN
jgi:hypothetical protein